MSHLVLYNTLYGGTDGHPRLGRGSTLEDPERPGRFHASAFGAYRLNPADSRFELAGATHYAHLDRPERGRDQLLRAVTSFLEH